MSDFPNKMTSLGEVQRIIGLSLSKIQMGRNQRGGLPLHKNLLVATVLNKARDLYMQETMYMNYKMMTGQFGTGPIGGVSGMPNSCLVDHSNMSGREEHEEEMEDTPEHEEYDEDSESDVEDECDISSNNTHHKHNHLNHNHHYHHNVNQLQNSLTSNASMNMGHASPCTSSMAAAMMMRAAAANANSMAAAAAASAASAASSSMGNSTDNENNTISGCSSFNALNMNNSAVNSGVVNNCFSQMSPMNMGMHMLQQQQQLQQHQQQQQQSQVPGGRNNQMQHNTQQSQFHGMSSHYAGMMPFFQHQQQMLLHHQQQQQLQQQQNHVSNGQEDDDNINLEQSQEEQQQHAAVAAMASQAAQVQAASLAAAAARAAVVNNVAAAAAAASTAINVSEEEIQQHKRSTSSSASSTSGSSSSSSNDEGFIDEPECDCDTRNFSNTTSDVRVPFQYCYHCAPFHPSNGRGPTLVPTPQTTPCTTATSHTSSSVELTEARGLLSSNSCCLESDPAKNSSSTMKPNSLLTSEESLHLTKNNEDNTGQCTKLSIKVSEESSSVTLGSHLSNVAAGRNDTNNNSSASCETNFTIYDMDSKSTERRSPCEFPATLRGTKRRRISGCETYDSLSTLKEDSETSNNLPIPNKRRRRSDGEDEDEERSSTSSEDGDGATAEESLPMKDTSLTLNDSGYHGETCKSEVG